MNKHLHIISLDVPWPPDLGGVFDLFYKLPALQKQGVKIHLHCFVNNRKRQPELNKYCEEVFYYKRNTGIKGFSAKLPYIVSSRINENLLTNLLKDDHPIFMEGVHCSWPVFDNRFKNRRKFIRVHNVESHYYGRLFTCSQNLPKKIYYWWESRILKKYEAQLVKKTTAFWPVTKKDNDYFRQDLQCKTSDYLPLFLPAWSVQGKPGKGLFCLYHGNLEISENEYAVIWLLKNIFNKLEIPLLIAGKNPTPVIKRLVNSCATTYLVANPSEAQMQDMIIKAQIHLLPSFNNTGIKIKLLNSLYNGRYCLANSAMVEGTGLAPLCDVADTKAAFIQRIKDLFLQPFTIQQTDERKNWLQKHFDNDAGAKQMVKWIWDVYA